MPIRLRLTLSLALLLTQGLTPLMGFPKQANWMDFTYRMELTSWCLPTSGNGRKELSIRRVSTCKSYLSCELRPSLESASCSFSILFAWNENCYKEPNYFYTPTTRPASTVTPTMQWQWMVAKGRLKLASRKLEIAHRQKK